MTDALPLMTSLQILATSVRMGEFDKNLTAEALEKLSQAVGRVEVECQAHRHMNHTRAFHRSLEEQAMRGLHAIGALPAEPPFQPIKTAQDLKADNVTPLRPRDRDKT
jgi:hypothetical protein